MKQREFHIGPGAASLMLVVVVVSMSVLSLLALISARNDYKLTERGLRFAESEYAASAAAERRLAQIDAVLVSCASGSADQASYLAAVAENLPEGCEMDGDTVAWEENPGAGRSLYCAVKIAPLGSESRYLWTEHMFVAGANESVFE